MRSLLVALSAASLAAAPGAHARPRIVVQIPSTELTAEPDKIAIDTAAALIKQSKFVEAIATLDPIIARYDAQWSHSDKLVFSARSTEETLMYSVLAQAGKIKRATVVIGPEWINALQLKAYSLVELNRVGDALPLIEKAVALAPMNSKMFSELGYTQGRAGQFERALASYDSALSWSSLSPDQNKKAEELRAHHGRGYVLTEMGKLDPAEAAYKKALALDHGDRIATHELLYIASKRKP